MKFLWLETQYNLDNLDVRQLRKRRAFEMAIAEMINLRHHYKSQKDYVMNFLNVFYIFWNTKIVMLTHLL